MALILTPTSSDADSDGDVEDDDEFFSELTHEKLVTVVKYLISSYHSKSKSFKILKKNYELLSNTAKIMNTKIKNLIMQNKILEEAKSSKVHKKSNKHENDLQEIIINSIERSKLDYMITVSVETRA